MQERRKRFILALIACLTVTAAAFCLNTCMGAAALVLAVPAAYIAYKPLIPTPAPIVYIYNNHIKRYLCKKKAPAPKVNLGGYREPEFAEFDADFYIGLHGDDNADGSKEAPFRTFERAKQAVRELDKQGRTAVTVAVFAGEYFVDQVAFSEEDSGSETCPVIYKAYGGEVILNGGISIPSEAFQPVLDQDTLDRLHPDAKEHIRVADLAALGLTKEQIGVIHVMGSFHLADRYDGDWIGPLHCELFVNNCRQTLARYPNGEAYLQTDRPIFFTGGSEAEQTGLFSPEARKQRNPAGDVYKVNAVLAERIASWKTLEDVWVFGFWMYDWADASTPIGSFDPVKRTLSPKFASQWGARKGAPYFFFNVLEELDVPGEWYLDRDTLKLYLYPQERCENAFLSITTKSILEVRGAQHLIFEGFTIQGTRGDAVTIESDNVVLQSCTIRNVASNAIMLRGHNNRVNRCHISHTGKAGVLMDGGDRVTLTPGANIVENCLIHSWSKLFKTYCPAVDISGVGNVCRHNEMYDSPHEVIWYHGNDHVIEYNHIHDTCLLTKDGGAIYAGKSWSDYGSIIRGNVIHDLGTPYFTATAIYLDDGMSGHTVCDNVLVNIPGIAIQLGGGRDYTVTNNMIINCANTPISYDNRAIEGALHGTWFHYCSEKGGVMWQWLHETAYKSEVWQKHYPQIAAFCEDFEQADSPYFVPNPGCSCVQNNLIFDQSPIRANIICKEAKRFGRIENNKIYPMKKWKHFLADPEKGDYSLK